MASYVWAKIWIEILYDYKMACLSDHLWRRTIELILLAKEVDPLAGHLPSIEEMAFKLHSNTEILEAELHDLAAVGITELLQDGWFLPNFKDRQRKMTGAERVALHRERKKKAGYYEGDTGPLRDSNGGVTIRYTEAEEYKEEERVPAPDFIQLWRDATGAHPGESRVHVIAERLGPSPDIDILNRAGRMWLGKGHSPFNIDGVCDWYEHLRREPGWSPSKRNFNGPSKADFAWSEVFGEIQRVGSREQPQFEGVTDKAVRQAGGYKTLCQMAERDAERTFKAAYQEAA